MENTLKSISAFVSAKKIIDKHLASDRIVSFVIGKTEDIENRQADERYVGYELHQITEDTPEIINNLEKVLILLSKISEPYNSLCENQNAGGGGNENAGILYVAIKTK